MFVFFHQATVHITIDTLSYNKLFSLQITQFNWNTFKSIEDNFLLIFAVRYKLTDTPFNNNEL